MGRENREIVDGMKDFSRHRIDLIDFGDLVEIRKDADKEVFRRGRIDVHHLSADAKTPRGQVDIVSLVLG